MNSEVLIDEKPVLWETFWKNGIVFVNDILDSTGEFLSYDTFCRLYGHICNHFNFSHQNQLEKEVQMWWIQTAALCTFYKMSEMVI